MNAKRHNTRITAALLAMAAAASMTGIAASAADYGAVPDYPDPDEIAQALSDEHNTYNPVTGTDNVTGSGTDTGNTSSPGTAAVSVTEASVPSILTAETVSAVINNAISEGTGNVTVTMSPDSSGNITVREDTIAAIASGNVAVTIEVAAGAGSDYAYSVVIDPSMVTNINGALNIAVNIAKTEHLSTVSGVYVPTNAVVISPCADGEIGASIQVVLPKDVLKGINRKKAHLYAISKNGTVVRVDDDAIIFNEDGSVSVFLDNGDIDLVISDKDLVKAAEKVAQKNSKKAKSQPGNTAGAVAVGAVDASAVSAAAVLSKKKKKKNKS